MALCNDSEMGKYALFTLLLLYTVVFLPTVLHNSETWNNLTQNDISKLTSAQNKYLKWMLHTPRGTCTSFTLLELGLLPIGHEVSKRKFNFLHHILNLPADDPVRIAYNDQKLYTNEPNWYNDICSLAKEYEVDLNEEAIQNMSKEKWKELTISAIHKTVLRSLYTDCVNKSKTANVPPYLCLSQQDYFQYLSRKELECFFSCGLVYMISNAIVRTCITTMCADCVVMGKKTLTILSISVTRSVGIQVHMLICLT